ncbi:DNA-binding SARP family transcriptional activator/DNA-binding XRE family transcriptional regulator [Hamadaea flava]|uniref:BTAD domain-containing putative transcriptional regulator n=1 Tax=Hamadaea flava TaxID=1742688 RepID=A0ABV8M2T4_9ACTN|nr:BTAD domain-containing putative transcriptional regulator [Hamadaea flava]MCP2328396.1 DNA-binding SARP family transcriptional activator/DNA-binding XRE family transcriptional regulator [Hamadaea flava]
MPRATWGSSPEPLAGLLRRLREQLNLTQQQLATAAVVSVAAIRDLEQGRTHTPRTKTVQVLAEYFRQAGVDGDALLARVAPAIPAARRSTAEPVDTGPLTVAVLGPLRIARGSVEVKLGSDKLRCLLARLALAAGTAVGREELMDLLWGPTRPPSATNLLHGYLGRLRRLWTGDDGAPVLAAAGRGYRLDLTADTLDLLRFRQLAEAGAATAAADPAQALGQLLAAARLWRGETDVEQLRDSPLIAALTEQYATVLCQAAALGRRLGETDQVLPLLRDLADRLELHEPLYAELVATAAAAGRQAEALAAYDRIRRALSTQLGVDPGVHLRQTHEDALRPRAATVADADQPSPPIRQVPAGPTDLVGRHAELDRIDTVLAPTGDLTVRLVLISGPAGVGKTALALTAAQRLSSRYPDGQLYADLRSGSSEPVAPMDVLGRFLRALGVPARRVGADEAEASALLRSVLADRRMLLVLDNVRDAAAVRTLAPGPGGCDVLVTSRQRLPDLPATTVVDLSTLSVADSIELMDATVGAGRMSADPASADELAVACGQWPLALRIAAGRLASRPAWTAAELARRLRDANQRLTQLSAGDSSVLASFQLSYQDLSEPARQAFRLCALHPGDDFGTAAAAELLGVDPATADDVLGELLDANMLLQYTAERFRFHDLLGLYAARLLGDEDPQIVDAARDRLHRWSLRMATAAVDLIYPSAIRLVTDRDEGSFPDQDAAVRWIDAEAGSLVALVERTAGTEWHRLSWLLAEQLRGYFLVRRHVDRWLRTAEAGLRAATADGDPTGQAVMLLSRGQARWVLGWHAQALEDFRRGEQFAHSADWPPASPYLWHNIGVIHAEQSRFDEAESAYREALRRCGEDSQLAPVRALALNGLGAMYADQGRLAEAADCLEGAVRINEAAGRTESVLSTRGNLGMVLRQLGREQEAEEHLLAALEGYRKRANPHGELSSLDEISQLHAQRGEAEAAVATAQRGYELAVLVRDQRAQVALLCTLGEAHGVGGTTTEALRCLDEVLTLATEHGYPYFAARAQVALAGVHLGAGARDAAARCARSGRDLAAAHDFRVVEATALAALARCLAGGSTGEAAAAAAVEAFRATGADELADRLRDQLAVGDTDPR